ncbi:MAG: hypothetical protein ACRELY_10175 [Polyangiaceae bacterium]
MQLVAGMLAPTPDFRYVGVAPMKTSALAQLLYWVGGGAAVGGATFARAGHSLHDALGASLLGAVSAGALHVFCTHKIAHENPARLPPTAPMGIVPWGVLIESEEEPRALRWPAIERVEVRSKFIRQGAIDSTEFSMLTIHTARERFVGRAFGDVPLDRLEAHLEAYSRESSHRIALDLDGARPASAHLAPVVDALLAAAHEYLGSSAAVLRLSLSGSDYRRASSLVPSRHAIEELRSVLVDRRDMMIDPRPFAAILAAEFRATELAKEIVALVQSPHPLVAAVAKASARKLGVAVSRAGSVEEVAPFLFGEDVSTLDAWVAST